MYPYQREDLHLPAGTYRLAIERSRGTTETRTVTVGGGEPTAVVID